MGEVKGSNPLVGTTLTLGSLMYPWVPSHEDADRIVVPYNPDFSYFPTSIWERVQRYRKGRCAAAKFGNVIFSMVEPRPSRLKKMFKLTPDFRAAFPDYEPGYFIFLEDNPPTPVWSQLKGQMYVIIRGQRHDNTTRTVLYVQPVIYFTHEEDAVFVASVAPRMSMTSGVMAILGAGKKY